MIRVRTPYVLVALLLLNASAANEENKLAFCGKISLRSPFRDRSDSFNASSSWLSDMILCRSGKLYFRTSVGLFVISSIDYSSKTLTVVPDDHQSCSESAIYVSPSLLAAGLQSQSQSQANSVLLFNCGNKTHLDSYHVRNCSGTHNCGTVDARKGHSCLLVDDIEKLGNKFHPGNLNCSHFLHVHTGESGNGYNVGMKVSFEVDHKPDLCQECRRLDGKCGVGLKCFCHLAQCVDKVVARSTAVRYCICQRKLIISFLLSTGVMFGFLVHI